MPSYVPCDLSLITISVSNCRLFSGIHISQGNVAMHLSGIFSYHLIANLLLSLSLTVKELWKSEFVGLLFWNSVVMFVGKELIISKFYVQAAT